MQQITVEMAEDSYSPQLLAVGMKPDWMEALEQSTAKNHLLMVLLAVLLGLVRIVLVAVVKPIRPLAAVFLCYFQANFHHLVAYVSFSNRFNAYT